MLAMNRDQPILKRISPRAPKELRDTIHQMAKAHIPRATHVAFFEYLLKNGMMELDDGVKLGKKFQREWEGDDIRFQHHVSLRYTDWLNRIADRLEPRPRKRELLIHILNLGIQFYYKEHDEFGIRRD